jgi:hypothetical protein
VIYNLLFQTSAATLLEIARDPRHLGTEIGFFARLCWLQAREQELLPARYVHLVFTLFTLPREPLVLSLLGGGLALMVAYAGVKGMLVQTTIGLLVGVPAALLAGHYLQSQLYEVKGYNVSTLVVRRGDSGGLAVMRRGVPPMWFLSSSQMVD